MPSRHSRGTWREKHRQRAYIIVRVCVQGLGGSMVRFGRDLQLKPHPGSVLNAPFLYILARSRDWVDADGTIPKTPTSSYSQARTVNYHYCCSRAGEEGQGRRDERSSCPRGSLGVHDTPPTLGFQAVGGDRHARHVCACVHTHALPLHSCRRAAHSDDPCHPLVASVVKVRSHRSDRPRDEQGPSL